MKIPSILLLTLLTSLARGQVAVFEEGVISDNGVFGAAMSPDGNHFLFVKAYGGRDTLELHQSTKVKGQWVTPGPAFFATEGLKQIDPSFSPDGQAILYNELDAGEGGYDVVKIEKSDSGWGKPQKLSEAINTTAHEFYATMSLQKNIYFVRRVESNDIYVSQFKDGRYQTAVPIAGLVNTDSSDSNPYISPDEDFLIFTSKRSDGFGNADLYISFNKSGTWSRGINLGPLVNSPHSDFCPTVDISGRRFLFARTELIRDRRKENIYHVPLEALKIEELREKAVWK